MDLSLDEVRASSKLTYINLLRQSGRRSCITHNSNPFWLGVELASFDFNFALSGRIGARVVGKINAGSLKADDVTAEWADVNLGMRLDHIDLIFKVNGTVTVNLKLLGVRLADDAPTAHINELREKFVLAGIDHREGVNRDQDLVTIAMDPHRVVVVLILIDSWGELNIDVLADTGRDHTLLLIANFEEAGLRRQNMEALGRG